MPQVVIGALHGAVSGGGFALALACDIRIAASNTFMNAAFINIGLSGCELGTSYHLVSSFVLYNKFKNILRSNPFCSL